MAIYLIKGVNGNTAMMYFTEDAGVYFFLSLGGFVFGAEYPYNLERFVLGQFYLDNINGFFIHNSLLGVEFGKTGKQEVFLILAKVLDLGIGHGINVIP